LGLQPLLDGIDAFGTEGEVSPDLGDGWIGRLVGPPLRHLYEALNN
jgi:hypothetical protein